MAGEEIIKDVYTSCLTKAVYPYQYDGIFLDFVPAKNMPAYVPSDEFLGKSLDEVFSTEEAQQAMCCIDQALQTGDTQVLRFRT